ncbi:beta-propeller fold lactonase family protein [Mycobacterium sp. C31M]
MATDYAKHVGRIGVLAVSLGIGYAALGVPAIAQASTDADSSDTSTASQSSSPSESPSDSPASSSPDPKREPDPEPADEPDDQPDDQPDDEPDVDLPEAAEPEPADTPTPATVRKRSDRDRRATVACTTCRDLTPKPEPKVESDPEPEAVRAAAGEPAAPAEVAVTAPAPSSPEPPVIPDVVAPAQGMTPVAAETATSDQSADTTRDIPVETPAALALLAWTRRQTEEALLPAAASDSGTGTPPTASPTQEIPDQVTGVVTGAINGAVNQPQARTVLTYSVTGGPGQGSLVVDAATGQFTYTPSAAARLAAGITPTADFDTFSVAVSDGVQSSTVTVTVPVLPAALSGPSSKGVGWSPAGVLVSATKIYVTNAGSNTVSVIDRATGSTSTIKVVNEPKAIALSQDGTRLYIGGSNAVSVINTATNTVLTKITTNGGQIYGLDVSADGSRIYVANNGKNTVSVINTATNTVIATIAVGSKPNGLVLAGSRLYVANNSGGTVTVIDTGTNKVVGSPITVGANPSELVASRDGARVYVTDYGSGTVSVIDTATHAVTGTVTVGAKPQGLALSPDGSLLYVANGRDTVSVVDTATRAVIQTVTIDSRAETGSHRLALSPDGSQIYITDMVDNSLRTLTLTRGNTAPTAGAPTVGTPNAQNGAVTGDLNITDPDGDTLTYTVTKAPTGGTLLINARGGYTFTPTQAARDAAAQTPGIDTVTFTVAANDGRVGAATVTVTVTVPIAPNTTTVPGDSTSLLQSMFDALKPGDTLTLAPQTYQHSGVLTIRVAGVTINGNGATLHATNDNTSSVQILADGVTLKDITLSAALTGPRYYAPQHHKLVIMADHVTVTDVTIKGSAGAGIYIDNAGYFELTDVRVIRSRADGIHMTNGSHNGVLNNPYTEWTGDDGIAVVSYVPDVGGTSRDIVINNPTVNGTTWGRGVSVVGGTNITYNNITVRDTDSAGVYIATEWSYDTRSVDGVRINGGTVTNANTSATVVHGAVLVYAGNAGTSIRNVTFEGLTVTGTPLGAGRILGMIAENGATVSGITFRNLTLQRSNTIAAAYTNVARSLYQMIGVALNGVAVTTL